MDIIRPLTPCLTPVSLCALSILSFHFTLHTRSQRRRACLMALTLYFEVLSFFTAHNFSGIHPGLVGLWAQCLALNLIHITSLIFIERVPAPGKGIDGPPSSWSQSLRVSYHFWSNPRLLPRAGNQDNSKSRRQSASVFIVLRLVKLVLYYYLDTKVVPLLFKELIGSIHLSDLTPRKYSLLRLAHPHKLRKRELSLRGYMAVSWIWESIVVLDGANAALGLGAVITGFDRPEDWPPLFGNLSHISGGLRQFWSRFWHPLAVRSYRNYGRLSANAMVSLLFRRDSPDRGSGLAACLRGMITALIVFLLSGLSHMAVSWYLGMHDLCDIQWFLLNFGACTIETAALASLRILARRVGLAQQLHEIKHSWLGSLVGLAWVCMFFFWSVPLWRYQRMYNSIGAAEEKAWQTFLSV